MTEIEPFQYEIHNVLEQFRRIETFILDIDGVLTDNRVLVMENGDLLRTMHVRDGEAMKRALKAGYRIAIISGMRSPGVVDRLKFIGIPENMILKGISNKLEAFEDLIFDQKIDAETALYMGDDMPDLPVLLRVGLPVCPSDAIPEVIAVSQYISPKNGGDGCVRDVIEKVMKLQNKWVVLS
jgi:3-deoxy-D-manno-octulosonate 8-phosphate phosphatase (KDO 8-P phosphatase)